MTGLMILQSGKNSVSMLRVFCDKKLVSHHTRKRIESPNHEQYYSRLESAVFIGGYLGGIEINFSEHLNTVIGGRGRHAGSRCEKGLRR